MAVHGEKLHALLRNEKLPAGDRPMVEEAIRRYDQWVTSMDALVSVGDAFLGDLVNLLNTYKHFIEYDLIFCSRTDFLYRQKGQIKLDNTILEEFLPRLVDSRLVPGIDRYNYLATGPQKTYSGLSFGYFHSLLSVGGISIKEKDQDFTVGKRIYLKAANNAAFTGDDTFSKTLTVGHFVAEIKTNLDKTMFQEASATSHELKRNVTGATYLLLCEWLDMPPIDSRQTDIDEVILLRKAKRLSSNERSEFSLAARRAQLAARFNTFLTDNPFQFDSFKRIVKHLKVAFPAVVELNEREVMRRGYF